MERTINNRRICISTIISLNSKSILTLQKYIDICFYRPHPLQKISRSPMAKIDPVSPFYPTLWLEKEILQWENLQEVQKTSL